MPRGGQRQGAGRKSTWASGCKFEDTKLIRVPVAIADRLLEIAHNLDAEITIDLETKSIVPITQALLTKRLGISVEQIRKSKGRTGDKALQSWSPHYDPDGIAWRYDSKTKKYTLAADLTPSQSSRLAKWLEVNQ